MILAMSRVRIMGPRPRLDEVLVALQDLGLLHLSAPASGGTLEPITRTAAQERSSEHIRAALTDVDQAIAGLGISGLDGASATPIASTNESIARWVRLAWQTRRATERLAARTAAIEDERALILKYQHFFSAFRSLLESES
ncbi:MAG: hypothetical protein ABUL71_02510, partial [Gemmatimonadota bacterium]